MLEKPFKIAYIVKRYPRFSETFIVNEIIAHEAAGAEIEIFSVRPCIETHFQDLLSRVKSPVRYIPSDGVKATDFWSALKQCALACEDGWSKIDEFTNESALNVYQGILVALAVRQGGFTHIHAHFASVAASVARIASLLTGVPYTITAHAKDIFHESVVEEDLRAKFRDAKSVVTVSDFNITDLSNRYPDLAQRFTRIYNGMDLARLQYQSPISRERTVVFVGRLVEKKGLPTLIEACDILRDRGVDFQCRIIGTGELEQQLYDLIESRNLRELVKMEGALPQRDVIDAICSASVVAVPCVVGNDGNRDGLPTVILEGMALGTPCVSTDVTGIPEVIRDGETGLLVNQFDAEGLAAAIETLLNDPTLRVSLAEHARDLIEREFDIVLNTQRIRELFSAVGVLA